MPKSDPVVKITAEQLRVLRLLGEPDAEASFTPYMGSFSPEEYWRVTGGDRATRQVEALLNAGLLDSKTKGASAYGRRRATINDAGRAVLAANPAEKAKPQTWYCVGKWSQRIDAVEVVRNTDSYIWTKGIGGRGKTAISSDYDNYFPTWEQARDHLLRRAQRELEAAERAADTARKEIAAIQKMKHKEQAHV